MEGRRVTIAIITRLRCVLVSPASRISAFDLGTAVDVNRRSIRNPMFQCGLIQTCRISQSERLGPRDGHHHVAVADEVHVVIERDQRLPQRQCIRLPIRMKGVRIATVTDFTRASAVIRIALRSWPRIRFSVKPVTTKMTGTRTAR